MGAALESLLALQDIELQIVDIRRQLAARQGAVDRQGAKLRSAQQALEEEQAELRRAQMTQDELELDLKVRQANIARLRENLNSVKTNKEYAALMSLLNNEKADATRLETRAYELLEGVEARKKVHAEHEDNAGQEAARLSHLEAQLAEARGSFASRLTDLEQRRDTACDHLDAKALDMFNRISERYDGEVMARVKQVHPRRQEFLCDGCNMALAAERANALMTRDDVITCDNCGRILYMVKDR